jgi:hypothetical protein
MISKGMAILARIAFLKMLVLLRLVIIGSLAAYSLPTVSFAMHGDASASYQIAAAVTSDHHSTVDDHAAMNPDHHDHGISDETADRDTSVKQDCCSDFCVSMAIVADCEITVSVAPQFLYTLVDDQVVLGQLTSLHRPPSVRT